MPTLREQAFTAWIYRLLNGRGRRAPAIGAVNASVRRIFPRWQSLVQFRTRKPTTHKYSFATFNGVKRRPMMRTPVDCAHRGSNHARHVGMGTQKHRCPGYYRCILSKPMPCFTRAHPTVTTAMSTDRHAASVRHRHGIERGPANAGYAFVHAEAARDSLDL